MFLCLQIIKSSIFPLADQCKTEKLSLYWLLAGSTEATESFEKDLVN